MRGPVKTKHAARKLLVAGALLLVALAVIALSAEFPLTVRLALGLRLLAAGKAGERLAVIETELTRTMDGQEVSAVLYRPSGTSAGRALLLVPGISELGCRHPRLVALSRLLAANGFMVLTPDIVPLRQFRIAPEALDHLSFWLSQLESLDEAAPARCIGLAGISFSGTLALIAAARPENRHRVAFVLSIGAYHDLTACAQSWFAASAVTVGEGYYPTRYYARWIAMLAALDLLPDAADRSVLQSVLTRLLMQQDPPPLAPHAGAQAARWYRLARAREDESDPELARAIVGRLAQQVSARLAPGRAASEIECPVFLAHGAFDDLIPPSESIALQQKITRARSWLLISPFLTHTHPASQELGLRSKTRAVVDILLFLHRLVLSSRQPVSQPCRQG